MSNATFEDHPTDPNKVILRKKPHLDKGRDYEEGFIDGMQHQMQSSVDRAVNAMAKREWVGLTDFDRLHLKTNYSRLTPIYHDKANDTDVVIDIVDKDALINAIEAKLKEKNT